MSVLPTACSCNPSTQGGSIICTTAAQCPVGALCIDGTCRTGTPGLDATSPGNDATFGDTSSPLLDAGDEDSGLLMSGSCRVDAVPDPFMNPRLELHWRGAGLPFPTLEHVVQSPVVINFIPEPPDAATVPEILFLTYAAFGSAGPRAVLRVVSGRAPYETRLTVAGDGLGAVADQAGRTASFRADTHLAAGDLNGDGRPEVVGVLIGGGATAIQNDGTPLWRVGAGQLAEAETTANASVAIADLNQDGAPEVIVGRVVLNGQTGTQLWQGAESRGKNGQGPLSCVADIVPTSPGMEVIAGQTVYSSTGEVLWDNNRDGFCAVADVVDAAGTSARDGQPEVIMVTSGKLWVLNATTGATVWEINLPSCGGSRGNGGAPTVADFDADGLAEIGVAGAFCYAVFDPSCTADIPNCHGNGILWQTATNDGSSNVTSSTVFDFNGDGTAEVVYNDERYFRVYEGATGAELFSEPNPSRTRTEQPIVVDVDNDGNAEIVFGGNREHEIAGAGTPAEERIPGLEIWSSADDSWVGARPVWNQHTYHIDNIGVAGSVPSSEPASWLSHNTYRLNAPADNALNAPDLAGNSVMSGLCEAGVLEVCVDVINRGDIRVGPVDVTFFAGDPNSGTVIGSTMTTMNLDRSDTERVCIDWADAPTTPVPVFVQIDAADAERECIEDNNVVALGERGCMLIL